MWVGAGCEADMKSSLSIKRGWEGLGFALFLSYFASIYKTIIQQIYVIAYIWRDNECIIFTHYM